MTMEEGEHTIKIAKTRKATGPDDIPVEFLKLLEDNGKKFLLQLFNRIYETGKIPNDWLKSTFVTIPPQINAKKCTKYRTISLMSHALKIFLRIIQQEYTTKFRKTILVHEMPYSSIHILVQHCRDVSHSVYMCLIDFEKAFDKIRHS
ncbi:Retrovirus-related Pol polyprotein LINE-1 [Ophiophagus hannah]|uniref:Retrovirus-related Pol polyprotein LINE-1 n=1 Tax=Ophiophagus hannah TaxID=8665 RepID=V8NKJ6_OPHHA|nr:Retrovirus-related Pol polyprotein LINE-1 [Ophiophagus hannah]